MDDAVDHQHVRSRQLRITGAEELAAAATQQIFPGKGVLFGHAISSMVLFGDGLFRSVSGLCEICHRLPRLAQSHTGPGLRHSS